MRITAAEAHRRAMVVRERRGMTRARRHLARIESSIEAAIGDGALSCLASLPPDLDEGERGYVAKELRNAGFVVVPENGDLHIYWPPEGQADQ